MRDNLERGDYRRVAGAARKILFPFYPAYVSGQEKAVTVAAKSSQFTAGETGKGQFLRGNRRNLAEVGVVRNISSLRRVAGRPYLCNGRGQQAGNMGKGECCFGFSERVLPRSLA